MLSITEKFDQWETEAREEGRQVGREEGRQVGREEGRQVGREEGRQEGLREGLRFSVKTLLAEKFGAAGIDFWHAALEPRDIAPWQNILMQLLHVKTLQEFQYNHFLQTPQNTSQIK